MLSFSFIVCLFLNLFKVDGKERHPIVRSDIDRLTELNIASYFELDDLEVMTKRRVRREVRDIPIAQWEKVAAAMNVMKFTSQEEGIRKYGAKFQNYDHMVCFHAQDAYSRLGDENHGGPQFGIWHRAYLLMFEDSLLAIDPSIEAVPYWDLRRDVNDPLHSIVWTDKYFGELMGDSEFFYAIKDGPFKHWPIGDAFESGCGEHIYNMWGQMRSTVNPEKSKYVTRMGGAMCNYTNTEIGTIEQWDECLNTTEYPSYPRYDSCYEANIHTDAHVFVGGSRAIDGKVVQTNETYGGEGSDACWTWMDSAMMVQTNKTISRYYSHSNYGCFECPRCDLDDESFACKACQAVNNGENCTIIGDDGTVYQTTMNNAHVEYAWGDFLDLMTSPNEPFFWFHHINLDRYNYIWQLYNYKHSKAYWLYPTYGYEYGINLDDVAGGPERPFVNLFDYMGEAYKDKDLTYRDIFDATTFELMPYTYDDIQVALINGLPKKKAEYYGSMRNMFGNFDKLGLISIILTICVIFFLGVWYLIYNCNLNFSSNTDFNKSEKKNKLNCDDMGIAMASRSIDSLQDSNMNFDNYGSV